MKHAVDAMIVAYCSPAHRLKKDKLKCSIIVLASKGEMLLRSMVGGFFSLRLSAEMIETEGERKRDASKGRSNIRGPQQQFWR